MCYYCLFFFPVFWRHNVSKSTRFFFNLPKWHLNQLSADQLNFLSLGMYCPWGNMVELTSIWLCLWLKSHPMWLTIFPAFLWFSCDGAHVFKGAPRCLHKNIVTTLIFLSWQRELSQSEYTRFICKHDFQSKNLEFILCKLFKTPRG